MYGFGLRLSIPKPTPSNTRAMRHLLLDAIHKGLLLCPCFFMFAQTDPAQRTH